MARMLTRIAFVISLLFSLLAYSSCSHSTEPGDTSPKDPRTYTWTIDTIAYPGSLQTNMQSIWGSSPNDVYVVGHNDSPGTGTMFHFDGEKWSTTNFHVQSGGTISGPIVLYSVYGFASNDVWVGGGQMHEDNLGRSFLMHFNGSKWTEQQLQGGRALLAVWGLAPNDVWAGGVDSTVYHYDGVKWSRVSVPFNGWFARIGGKSPSDVYATAYHFSKGPTFDTSVWSLLHWDGKNWTLKMRFNEFFTPDQFGRYAIHVVDGTYYSVGSGYFKNEGDAWQRIFYGGNQAVYLDFAALHSNDVFLVGGRGIILHYNGSDWYGFPQLFNQDFMYGGCWRTDREVFIVGHNGYKTLVLHGK